MCFNTQSSLTAFILGSSACFYLVYQRHYFYGLFGFSIVIMQLLEYFAHRSLKNNNIELNILSSKLMMWTIFFQPLIYCFLLNMYPPKGALLLSFPGRNLIVLALACIYIVIFGFYLGYASRKKIYRVGFMNKCRRVCRLNWRFIDGTNPLGIILLIIYFTMVSFYLFYYPGKAIVSISNYFMIFLLVLSILYVILKEKMRTFPLLVSSFGSLWCFLAVFYPILFSIYAYNKLI